MRAISFKFTLSLLTKRHIKIGEKQVSAINLKTVKQKIHHHQLIMVQ